MASISISKTFPPPHLLQHEVLACIAQGIAVILTNHSNSERGYLKAVLAPRLQEAVESAGKDYSILVSSKDRDPLETW